MAQDKIAIARPYAEAVLARAQETSTLDLWSDMLRFISTLAQTPEVVELVANPKISRPQVAEILLDIVSNHCNIEGQNLLRILMANNRVFLAPQIADLYELRKRESQGYLN